MVPMGIGPKKDLAHSFLLLFLHRFLSMAFYFALMNVSNKKDRRRSSSRPSHSSSLRSFYDSSPIFPSAPSNSFESITGSLSQGEGTPNSIVPSSTASFPPPVRTSKKVRFKPQSPSPSAPSSSSTPTRNYFLGSRRVSRLYQPLMLSKESLDLKDDRSSIGLSPLSFLRGRHREESIEVQVQNEYNALIERMESRRRMEEVEHVPEEHESMIEGWNDQWNEREERGEKRREEWRDGRVIANWTRKDIGLSMMSEIHFINPSFVCLDSERDWFMSMTRECSVY
ncbi:hypothetical protein PMAYCL1PPCAC_06859 [Pristionchus mayeri]|uniref:Uncharacterized protein n=1 Tax=Pristionchus mayeri TaxID=1317129 RepID=A0AAN5CBZ7_9BILA|nr:hypothetical protein PMAYCL1PPCAC_06859 [Pristionchus mayeri]